MSEIESNIRHLRVLNSPIRLQILTYLRAFGSRTVSEIAEWIGIEDHLLYYHLGQLAKAEFVEIDGTRPGATKPETIYRAKKRLRVAGPYSQNEVWRKDVAKNVAQVLRIAAREYESALEAYPETASETCSLHRMTARLTSARRAELRQKINELADWIRENEDESGDSYTATFVVSNLAKRTNVVWENDSRRTANRRE
ncbi:MAG: helix-turn-helix domain-containing protein [Fimbriimonas sp.]|nr:helix-turn-helix domain-containing protein [Fimbriimonas sp.]